MSLDLTKAFESRVVMLSGEEEALRRRAMLELLQMSTIDGDFDLQTFEADEAEPVHWVASAGTAPFLSRRRTVVVRHLLRWDLDDGQPAGLKELPETAFLLLVVDEEPGDENKQRKLANQRKAWEKIVKNSGGAVLDFTTSGTQLHEALRREAELLGKKISQAGAETLVEMTGGSFSRALGELEKLAIYIGSETQIQQADIRAAVVPSREWNVYHLVDAIVAGAVPEALRQLRVLVGSQTKAEDAAFSRILPTLSRQLRLLWQARICVEAKCGPGAAPPPVAALFASKANISKEPPYRQSKLMQHARRVDFEALSRCFRAVSDADSKLKGLLDSFSGIETLEQMVLEMVEAISARHPTHA